MGRLRFSMAIRQPTQIGSSFSPTLFLGVKITFREHKEILGMVGYISLKLEKSPAEGFGAKVHRDDSGLIVAQIFAAVCALISRPTLWSKL